MDEIPSFEDTLPAEAGAKPLAPTLDVPKFEDTIPAFEETAPVESSPLLSSTGEAKGNLESFALGVKEQLAPFNMSQQEYLAEKDTSEKVANVAGNVTAAIAGGALGAWAGGALGSFVAPGPGTVAGVAAGRALGAAAGTALFAIYSGLGKEKLRSQAEGKTFDPFSRDLIRPSTLLAVGTELNPLAKYGGKLLPTLGKQVAARIGTQAGLEAAWDYSHSGSVAQAAAMGGIGAVLGTAFSAPTLLRSTKVGASAAGEAAAAKTALSNMEDVLNSDKGLELLTNATQRAATEAREMDIQDLDFQRWVLQSDAKSETVAREFTRKTAKWTPEQFQEAWKAKEFKDIMADEAAKTRASMSHEIAAHGVHDNTALAGRKLKDAKFVARDADMVTGLNLEGMLDEFSEARNKHNFVTMGFLQPAEELAKKARKFGLSNQDVGYAVAEMNDKISPQGRKILATEEGQKLLNGWTEMRFKNIKKPWQGKKEYINPGWKGLFRNARTYMQDAGYDIGDIDNYLPMYSLRGVDLSIALEKSKIKLAGYMQQEGVDNIASLKSPDAVKLVNELNAMYKNAMGISEEDLQRQFGVNTLAKAKGVAEASDATFSPAITSLDQIDTLRRELAGQTKTRTGYELSALLSRRGEMPELMRNFDINDLFLQYLNGNMKSVHFDKAFRKMDANIGALDALGMKETAKYFSRLSRDIAGAESGWMANLNRKIDDMRFAAEKTLLSDKATDWDRYYAKALKGAPEMLSFFTNMVYPSYLGFNVKATARNYTQNLMVTAPELGHGYGEVLAGKSLWKMAHDKIIGKVDLEDFLQKRNLLGDRFHGEALTTEMGQLAGNAKELANKFGNFSMWAYGKSDGVNRYWAYTMGQQWAKDLIANEKGALIALSRASTGLKAAIKSQGIEKDAEKLGDALGRYLISKTQFNYGKEQLSEFGREYGRMFSMFTKWPVMVGSDVVELFKKHGAAKGGALLGTKYLVPLMALTFAGKVLLDVDKNPTAKYLIGNPAQLAPISSLQGVASGQLGSPLMRMGAETLSGFYDIATDTASGDKKKAMKMLGKGVREVGTTFVPGAAVINELDRIQTARGKKKVSQKIVEGMGFPKQENKK